MEKKMSHGAACEVGGAAAGGSAGVWLREESLSVLSAALQAELWLCSTAAITCHGNFLCAVLLGHLCGDLQPYSPILG